MRRLEREQKQELTVAPSHLLTFFFVAGIRVYLKRYGPGDVDPVAHFGGGADRR